MDDLNIRSKSAKLGAAGGAVGTPGPDVDVLVATPCAENGRYGSRWRTIDLWSQRETPWEATIRWSGGRAGERYALLTIAKSTRLCVHAASVRVVGRSLHTDGNDVWAAISDGQTDTENEYSLRGELIAGTTTVTIAVPPFAKYVRMELGTETEYALSTIALIDGWGVTRNVTRGDRQPSPGLPVGDSQSVTITTTNPVMWRVTFLLNL